MIVDIFDILGFNSNIVISVVVPFISGMVATIIYIRLKELFKEPSYQADQTVIEAIVSNYTQKLKDYGKAIAELRVKMSTLELRVPQKTISQTPNIVTTTEAPPYSQSTISQHQSQSQLQAQQPYTYS